MSAPLQFLNELLISQFLALAGDTVLTYDYLLTFNLEMDYIWSMKWTTVKVLFLLNRYGTLIGQFFLTLQQLGILSHGSRTFCARLQWFLSFFILFSSETTRSLLLLRAWSLWRCSPRVAISLVSVYVVYVLAYSGYISYIIFKYFADIPFGYLEETGVCVVYPGVDGTWFLGLISFLLDTVVFTVIGYYLYKLCRGSESLQDSPLIRLLLRDAMLFYAVNIFYDVLDILSMSVLVDGPLYLIQTEFSFPLLIVAGQRAVLNLRGFQSQSFRTQDISRFVDGEIAAMQHRSFWQSVDLWVNDLHQESESRNRTMTTTTGSHITEEGSHELEVIHTPVGPEHTFSA